MTIALREDIMYILLEKIGQSAYESNEGKEVSFTETDFAGRQITQADLLGHLDYLNQKAYIEAEFEGNAYATQEDVPDVVNPEQVEQFRVANTLGAEDGPLPHLIRFKQAKLTEKGKQMLKNMEEKKPEALERGPSTPIASENQPFLEKVKIKAGVDDIFDARDLSEVVFRSMRDLMTTEAADRVFEELKGQKAVPSDDQSLQDEISGLWKDTNPIVAFLSRVRPVLNIDDETFLFRIRQEGGLQRGIEPEVAINAVFSATKDELSQERIQEIAEALPGKIRQLWEKA
ncbi:hypothetical protein PCC7418_1840 [Halothece sp. PCC 7418]|uniref:DUF2267 domain-containing protein n=1 Tax=Halothece sp. (strain PCC 7418) TaxID=65093 RepID=UPI0002A06370|nr:DUF2267 domain-containing protein [Halothece sp. PCC 7418]AFZ44008.1 hypothetical protein PCC7418_1840 [Halothece sp. PCC 7418]